MNKIILILILLFAGFARGQFVTIPDANFKAKLIALGIDTNADGNIQHTEAEAQSILFVEDNSISDFTGLEAFTNISQLSIGSTAATSINFSGNSQITLLSIYLPAVSALNLSMMTNLRQLAIDSNTEFSSIDLSGLVFLNTINIKNSAISSINFTGLNQLREITLKDNANLTSIQADGLSQLNTISLMNTQPNSQPIVSISLTNCTSLSMFELSFSNSLQSLNLANCSNLITLSVSNNPNLNYLNIHGCTALALFECSGTALSTLDLSDNINLGSFACSALPLAVLDVSANVKLTHLTCNYNSFASLDVSSNVMLTYLSCTNCNNLRTIFMKNGTNEHLLLGGGSLPLDFVCADEGEFSSVQSLVDGLGLTTVVGDYCSFTPGGDYNTITGNLRYDYNNNGCDLNDQANPYLKININDNTNTGSTFTNNSGNYTFYTQAGNFTLTPDVENLSYFNFSPPNAVVNFPAVDNSIQTQDFCISANGVHPDLEVIFVPLGKARPGFDASYKIVFKNKGNQTLTGNVKLSYDSNKLDYIATFPDDNFEINPDEITWNYNTLQPFETRNIDLTLHVNAPPTVNSGDVLNFTTTINPVAADETPLDNVSSYHQTAINSYDPNQMECLEGNVITTQAVGNYLHYNINFENVGTADAINIVVKDTIDTAKFDISSLRLQYASHDVETRVSGNIVEFIFKNIHLQPSSGNPIGGHGNVLFKIRTVPNLVVGDEVMGNANIFFDYNAPIATNEERTLIAALSNDQFVRDETVSIAPNPTKNNINVTSKYNIRSILLFDAQGRLLQTVLENSKTNMLDITNHSNGVYFLKVNTEMGSSVYKIVKE